MTNLINNEISDSRNIDESLRYEIALDVIARKLHSEIFYNCDGLTSYLRAHNWSTKGEKDNENRQDANLVKNSNVIVRHKFAKLDLSCM